MDRLFLDANVLFSAAYRQDAGLRGLWSLKNVKLYSSLYAVEEADRNLSSVVQQQALQLLLDTVEIINHEHTHIMLPNDIVLRDKDKPILQAAIYAQVDYLITGDFRDFGQFFGKTIRNVVILPPAEYLRNVKPTDI